MPQLIDLSHTIEHGMVTYKGLPAPVISDYMSRAASNGRYAPGTEFHIGKIEMVANTGTYIDSPFHRYADGGDLADLPLRSIANLESVVVRWDMSNGRAVGTDAFKNIDARGKAILVHTGWDRHWRTEQYFNGHPYLTRDAAQWLVDQQAALVGIDSLNIDSTEDGTRPAHTLLLSANIPIVEHLCNLHALPEKGFRFFAVPVKVKQMGSFPVRAFALIE
ncbi:MAG TPA: cyclase family protein [Bacteroidota bacterium]|nr:cyclase family protein [Bacteroidota bacterium]